MRIIFIILILSLIAVISNAQNTFMPQELQKYFNVPDSLKNDFGKFRSPLIFKNGDTVKTSIDWKIRKQEIKDTWIKYLGNWPDLDKNQQLCYVDSVEKDGYIQFTVSFNWTPLECTQGYLLVPKIREKSNPAVVTVFYDPETAIGLGKANRDFALQLVRQNFIVLSIGTKEASAKEEYALYYPSINDVTVQPLSMLGYAANAAYYALSNRDDVDSNRIGIIGHSFGGKWAMFASCLSDNYAAAVWSDPGIVMTSSRPDVNYWEPWYLGFHPKPWRKRGLITEENPSFGPYNDLIKKGHNLHELHVLMAPRPFLVSGGAEDTVSQWKALNHSIAVNELLGVKNRVAMSNRDLHDPNDESNKIIVMFFKHFL